MRFSVFFIALALVSSAQQAIIVDDSLKDHVRLADAALYVVKRYISSQSNTLIIMENCKICDRTRQNYQSRFLHHFLKNFAGTMSLQLFVGEPDDQPWNHNFFLVDSVKAFEELRFHFPNTLHDREFYFFIVLTTAPFSVINPITIMNGIFLSCMLFNVLHVVIMLEDFFENIVFYTYRLYGYGCNKNILIYIANRFRNGRLVYDYLFPPRLRNFNGCPLNVAANELPPLLMFAGDTQNATQLAEPERLSGIDGEVLKVLAKVLNFKYKLVFPDDTTVSGADHNSTGCLNMLDNGTADIAIGAMSGSHPQRVLYTASMTYHQGPSVFVVRNSVHHSVITQFVRPFSTGVWLTILCSFAAAIVFIKFIRKCTPSKAQNFILGPQNRNAITTLIIIFLGNPIPKLPRRNFARFLFMSWMLLTLVLRNAYQGKMFDAMRVFHRLPLPRNLHELVDNGYTLLAINYQDFYPENNTRIVSMDLMERYAVVSGSIEQKLTTLSMLDNLAHFNRMNWNVSTLTFVREPVYMFQLVMYFPKHSVLKIAFDRKIKQLMAAGIIASIEKQYVKRKFQALNADILTVPQINNRMLTGLYGLYSALMQLSVWIFIMERLSLRFTRLRRLFLWIHSK